MPNAYAPPPKKKCSEAEETDTKKYLYNKNYWFYLDLLFRINSEKLSHSELDADQTFSETRNPISIALDESYIKMNLEDLSEKQQGMDEHNVLGSDHQGIDSHDILDPYKKGLGAHNIDVNTGADVTNEQKNDLEYAKGMLLYFKDLSF